MCAALDRIQHYGDLRTHALDVVVITEIRLSVAHTNVYTPDQQS